MRRDLSKVFVKNNETVLLTDKKGKETKIHNFSTEDVESRYKFESTNVKQCDVLHPIVGEVSKEGDIFTVIIDNEFFEKVTIGHNQINCIHAHEI